jgi:hypothetical protein
VELDMRTNYPFRIPDGLVARLPAPSHDGLVYTDVRFGATWEGILVINDRKECIGVFAGRRIIQWPLPFTPAEIVDFRPPSLKNQLLTFIPHWFDILSGSLVAVWIVCPILIIAAHWISPVLLWISAGLALSSIVGLHSLGGFIMMRLPTASMAFAQILLCVRILIRH